MTQETNLKSILEAVLLAAGEPLSLDRLQAIFGDDENQTRPSKPDIRQALTELSEDYETHNRSLILKEVASGFCLQISQQFSPWVNHLWQEKPPRYSRAVMETLAIIAYRQPVTRAEIEDIRGVAVSSNVIKTLLEREWIHIIGERETPGRPSLYATTHHFLDYFNLKSLEDLPTLMQLQAFSVEGIEEAAEKIASGESLTDEAESDLTNIEQEANFDEATNSNEISDEVNDSDEIDELIETQEEVADSTEEQQHIH